MDKRKCHHTTEFSKSMSMKDSEVRKWYLTIQGRLVIIIVMGSKVELAIRDQ